eukprot:4404302-Alexandrium_andersonii.AAC.1
MGSARPWPPAGLAMPPVAMGARAWRLPCLTEGAEWVSGEWGHARRQRAATSSWTFREMAWILTLPPAEERSPSLEECVPEIQLKPFA